MLNVELAPSLGVHHIQQDRDGASPAGGGVLSGESFLTYLGQAFQKRFEAAGRDRFGHEKVGCLRILVGRIMREIRTDDEEILFREIRCQDLGNLLQDAEPLRPDHDRDDQGDFLENHLEKRQLDFQAVLPVMGVMPEKESALAFTDQLLADVDIDRHAAQGSLCTGIERIHAGTCESDPVAGAEEEDPLVGVIPGDPVIGRCRHLAAEHVAGMRDDQRLWRGPGSGLCRMQPIRQHGADFLRG